MKKIIIILFIIFILVSYIIYNNKNIQKDDIIKIGTGQIIENNQMSIDEALSMNKMFSFYFFKIKGNYNLSTLLIKEFKKVKTIDNFTNFEKKFGDQLMLFTSLKLKKKDLYLKYFSFFSKTKAVPFDFEKRKTKLIELYNINRKNNNISWLYDKGKFDYFLLSLSSISLENKINECKVFYTNDKDTYKSCVRFIIYMVSSDNNNYCDKLNNNYYKKWCNDSLKITK